MKKIIAVTALLLLSACAMDYKTYDAKGNEVHEIKCSEMVEGACFEKAQQVCPNGYITVNSDLNVDGAVGSYGGGFASMGTTKQRRLTVRCKS